MMAFKLTTLVLLALVVAAACLPAAAAAGPYSVDHCRHYSPESPFVAFGTVTGATVVDCDGGTGGLNARAAGGQIGPGDSLQIALSIPPDRPNIRIEKVRTRYSADAPLNGSATLSFRDHAGAALLVNSAPNLVETDVALAAGARQIAWRLTCNGPGACQFPDEYPLFVNKNQLSLNETVEPATLVVTGGALVSGGAQAGRQAVRFDGSDPDSGLEGVTVTLGSTVVGSASFRCEYADWSVCPRALADQSVVADTTLVPDGNHELRIALRDAAANTLTRSLGTITVANGPPGGAPIVNGDGASRQAKITARFTTTRSSTRHIRFTSRPRVVGRLVDERGRPIGGATISIRQRLRETRATSAQIATVVTAADGTFAHVLASGPSRTITFAYTAFSTDAKPSATASLRALVRAQVKARVTPRSTRPGQRVTLAGRLLLAPRAGVEVKIQARDRRRWRTIDEVKTKRDGAFRWTYRFGRGASGRTYAFRARADSPIYPFAAGNSKPVLVSVR